MGAHATLAPRAPGPRLSQADLRRAGWVAVAAAVLCAAVGVSLQLRILYVPGLAFATGIGALLAPEVMLGLFVLAPAVKGANYLSAIPFDLTLFTAAGVIVAIIARLAKRDEAKLRFPAITVLAPALATLALLSVLWSPARDVGLSRAVRFETLTMLAFVAPFVLIRSRAELKRVAVILLLGGMLISLTAVQTGHGSSPVISSGGDEIDLALGASVGLFCVIGYLVMVDRRFLRPLWLVPVILVFVPTVFEAGSRGVLIGTALGLLIVAGLHIKRARLKLVPVALIALSVALIVVSAPKLAGDAGQKYSLLFSGSRTVALGARNELLVQAWQIAVSHPQGLGIGGFTAKTGAVYPHNALLEAADEEGMIGCALLAALFVAAWLLRRRAPGGVTSPESIFLAGLFGLVVAESMFSSTFTQFRILWFVLGLCLALPAIRITDDAGGTRIRGR